MSGKPIYLDYHATTPCDPAVVQAMLPYLGAEAFGNPSAASHASGRKAARALASAKESIAGLIGAAPEAITLTSGATEANNIAILGAVAANQTCRREILVSAIEHESVLKPAQQLAGQGYNVKIIPATKDGFITPEALGAMISDKTRLVSVGAANHEIGTIQPVRELAGVAHAAGALFHCDAAQAAGHIPLDVAEADIDLLGFSGHKMYGPPGIGVLYARIHPPVPVAAISHGGMQQRLRPGTVPLALAVGLGEACRIAGKQMAAEAARLNALAKDMLGILAGALPALKVNGALHSRLPGSLNLCIPGMAAEELLLELADDLCLATGAACRSASGAPSPVLTAIGLTPEEAASSIRLSMGRGTAAEDMRFAARGIIRAVLARPAGALAG